MSTKVPNWLIGRLAGLAMLLGLSVGGVYVSDELAAEGARDEYVQAVAADPETSDAVKVAMVLGRYYESSGRHIGTPYVDKLGKGQPLTVCNGVTGQGVVAGKWYTPADCYTLERGRYIASEVVAGAVLTHWRTYDVLPQATFIDFVHNKGPEALRTSTMARLANAGDMYGACMQNPRWNKGTVRGVSTVLPGLQLRGDSNAEICAKG